MTQNTPTKPLQSTANPHKLEAEQQQKEILKMSNTHLHYNKKAVTLSNGLHHIHLQRGQYTPAQINEAITLLGGDNPTYTYSGGTKNLIQEINHTYYAEDPSNFFWTRTHCLAVSFANYRETVHQAINWATRVQDAEVANVLYSTQDAHVVFTDFSRDYYERLGERGGGAWVSTSKYAVTPFSEPTPIVVGEAQMIVDAINAHDDGRPVVVFTDSLLCVKAFERGEFWRFEELPGGARAVELYRSGLVHVFKVKSHSYNVGNDLVDALAQCARKGHESDGRVGDLGDWLVWFYGMFSVV